MLHKEGSVTIIGANTDIVGNLESESTLEIFGSVTFEGEGYALSSKEAVKLKPNSHVKGNVFGKDTVELYGYLEGNIVSEGSVKLYNGSKLLGGIKSNALIIEEGAYFNGSVGNYESTVQNSSGGE